VVGVEFQREEQAVGGERAREPEGAVAAEGAYLQDAAGMREAREQMQELALVGRNVDGGKPGGGVGGERSGEGGVVTAESVGEVGVDSGPLCGNAGVGGHRFLFSYEG